MIKIKHIIENNFYFLGKAIRYEPTYLIVKLLMTCFISIRSVFLSIYLMKYVVEQIEQQNPYQETLKFLILSFLFLCLTFGVEQLINHVYFRIKSEKIGRRLQEEIFEKMLKIDTIQYNDKNLYDQVTLAGEECSGRILAVLDNFFSIVSNLVTLTSIIALVVQLDLMMIVLCVLSFIIAYVVNTKISKRSVQYNNEMVLLNKEDDFLKRTMYLPEYANDIRTTDILDLIKMRICKNNVKRCNIIDKEGKKIYRLKWWNAFLSEALLLDFFLPFYLVIKIFVFRTLLLSSFIALINASYQLKYKFESIVSDCMVFYSNGLYIDRFVTFEKIESKIEQNFKGQTEEKIPFNNLFVDDITFAYPDHTFAIENLSLNIQKGDKIAIVGENGSGKTTLIHMLLRLYDVENGEIRLNGRNIREISTNQYRNCFSLLPQDFQTYATTVGKNISMDTDVNAFRISDAVKRSGFDIILKNGGNSVLSELTNEFYDDGIEFSGGQRQKLALSRCFYKDSEIFIMDEPTSALDIRQEEMFYQLVENLAEGKTIIFVSHRLASVKLCNKIIYMEKGRIIEMGTHEQLCLQHGKYAEMFEAQQRVYFPEIGPCED